MRNAIVRLGLLLVVAALAVGAWFLVSGEGDGTEAIPPGTRLYAVPQEAILTVTVQTRAAMVTFERQGETWYFADENLIPVNLDRWGGVVLLLSGPEVERRLPTPGALSEFGLDEPDIINIGLAGDRHEEVRLGAETPDGRNVYAQLGSGSDVALVNEPWARVLRRLADEPPLPYWYYRVDPERVRLLEIESPDGIVTFLLGLAGVDGVSPDRVVQGDAAADLTGAERDAVLDVAGGPPGFGAVAWPEGLTLEDAGLQPPLGFVRLTYELTVPLEEKSAASAVYAIGARTPGGDGFYAATPDSPLLLSFDAGWVEEVLSLAGRDFAGDG